MKSVINIALVFIISVLSLYASQDKDQLYNELVEKYSDPNSISLRFKSLDNKNIEGSLTAKKGNKYILKMGSRIITCNAKSIWNYSIDDNNVIISKFDKDIHTNSIEQTFFYLLKAFSPIEMKHESSSKGTSFTVLTLKNIDNTDSFDVAQIKLWISRSKSIESISLIRNGKEEKWAVWDIFTNKKIADKDFDFKVPKGAEVIDLR